jgi:hypothetical protein
MRAHGQRRSIPGFFGTHAERGLGDEQFRYGHVIAANAGGGSFPLDSLGILAALHIIEQVARRKYFGEHDLEFLLPVPLQLEAAIPQRLVAPIDNIRQHEPGVRTN